MPISQILLPEFDQEMSNTRKVLERVPDGKFDWKPHAKSGSMGWLAGHVANLPSWCVFTLKDNGLDLAAMKDYRPPEPKSARELVDTFDKNVQEARAAIEKASDDEWMKPWTLSMGEQKIFTLPRAAVVRSSVMNHIIHHRAQLVVYLRLNDVAVPGLYGPSADEQNMFGGPAKA